MLAKSFVLLLSVSSFSRAFQVPNKSLVGASRASNSQKGRFRFAGPPPESVVGAPSSSSCLQMYNLPPSGGGNNDFRSLATSALTLLGVIAFFASPLGGLFFFAFNSLFLLLLLVPIVGIISFNAWQFFNTVEGPCPSCGAPTRVVKNEGVQPQPGLCVNCGAFVTANSNNDGVEIFRGANSGVVDPEPSLFDGFFSDFGGTGGAGSRPSNVNKNKLGRDQTVIDVDIEYDEPRNK